MARIQEEIVILRLSRLVKNNDEPTAITDDDFASGLEEVVKELVGDNVIVEVERSE